MADNVTIIANVVNGSSSSPKVSFGTPVTANVVTGARGEKGDTGPGVPNGGTTDQILKKNSNADQDTEWHTPIKADVGLSNVDNTSDADKPVSTAQATAIGVVQSDINAHEANTSNPHSVTKSQVGLGNADNTSDANKPVSTATQTALDAKVAGPASVTDDLPAVFDGTTGKLIKSKTYAAFKTLLALVKGDVGLGNVDDTSDATKNSAVATLTNKTLTSPVINTPTGIVKGDVGLGNVDNTSNATERAATATLTNKRITPRITTITSSGTPTINTDDCDVVTITAQAAAITSMTTNLSGTPTNFQKLLIRIKDDGTARAITWGASYASRGATLPTTTVLSKVTTVGLIYNTVTSTWDCVAAVTET